MNNDTSNIIIIHYTGILADRTNLCDTVEKDSLKLSNQKDEGKYHPRGYTLYYSM